MASGKYLNDGYVLAFKLDGKATLPKVAERTSHPRAAGQRSDAAQLENGKYTYTATCMVCHGALVVSGGVIPDLRRLHAEKHAIFKQIVYDGVIHAAGMPRLGDLVSEQDVPTSRRTSSCARQDRAAAATAAATK